MAYFCSKHGDQGQFIGLMVRLDAVGVDYQTGKAYRLPKSLETRANRMYCMACWIDMMDRELLPLVAVPDER